MPVGNAIMCSGKFYRLCKLACVFSTSKHTCQELLHIAAASCYLPGRLIGTGRCKYGTYNKSMNRDILAREECVSTNPFVCPGTIISYKTQL